MNATLRRFVRVGIAGGLALVLTPLAQAQRRPYLGYAFPAGGQAGSTVQLRLGGQDLDAPTAVMVTGEGVSVRIVEYLRRLNNQEIQLLNEQLKELKKAAPVTDSKPVPAMPTENPAMLTTTPATNEAAENVQAAVAPQDMIADIELRTREWVATPACASIASLMLVEVVIAPDARPGSRELRLVTARGVSNPVVFQVGQFHEYVRKPMISASLQVLGKEAAALRKRPPDEVEAAVDLPCTVNGQIASGEVNRYRFKATKGQHLVFSTQARQLIPYIADAVPGWFQPVLLVTDTQGRELAFDDDYRFQPDPVLFFEVPSDGEYTFAIHDAIYRGREDFVYRITVGERPFVTSLYPLGAAVGAVAPPAMTGWNLQDAKLTALPADAAPGLYERIACRSSLESNPVPFAIDILPEAFDHEPNNTVATAQQMALPVIVNGRINQAGDCDVYQFSGATNQQFVAEVTARRLYSPLDSVLKLTDASGRLLACNDDHEDLTSGVNTHHADSYLTTTLPADGTYFLHLGDTAHHGGEEYGYRLRISAPQPDFALRVVPSSASMALNSSATVNVYVMRKDGCSGPISLELRDPPPGFSAAPVTLTEQQLVARFTLKGDATATVIPVRLTIVGRAQVGGRELVREAVPAEDRMQAFLWRHLVPAAEMLGMIHDPKQQPPPKRTAPPRPAPAVATNAAPDAATLTPFVGPPTPAALIPHQFTKQQIAGRLQQLKKLYEDALLTEEFYDAKISQCELAQ